MSKNNENHENSNSTIIHFSILQFIFYLLISTNLNKVQGSANRLLFESFVMHVKDRQQITLQ